MFNEMRYWSPKETARIVAAVALLIAVAVLWLNPAEPSGRQVGGIVLSSGAIARGKTQGGTREAASIQLPDGRIVSAMVLSGGPLSSGTHVTLSERSRLIGGPIYEVVTAKP